MRLLVSGAFGKKETVLPERLYSTAARSGRQNAGAVLWELDTVTGEFSEFYVPDPKELASFPRRAPEGGTTLDRFTGMCEHDGRLFLATFNEVIVLDKATAKVVDVHSQPSFNDLHHCLAYEKGQVVVNTGMDCIEIFDPQWNQIDRIPLDEDRDIDAEDWRLIPSTKPHKYHVNYAFFIQDELWCTRALSRDAVKVYDPAVRMEIERGVPHDGLVCNGEVFFTTVNGWVVAHSAKGAYEQRIVLKLEDILSCNQFGWVRGFCNAGEYLFVGTTKLRATKSREFLESVQGKREQRANSAVFQFDAENGEIIATMETPNPHANVFSILQMD